MNVSSNLHPQTWLTWLGGQPNAVHPLWALFFLASVLWLVYRLIRVFCKPAAEIEELLGYDIPPQPEIALSNVGSNSVTLYWKAPDNYHTPTASAVSVNGVIVAEFEHGETAVTVSGLEPGHHYNIRALSTNNAGFTSYSRLVQVQTIPLHGHRASKLLSAHEAGSGKRPSTGGRRVSAPFNDGEKERSRSLDVPVPVPRDEPEGDGSLLKLNQKLDALRVQQEDLEEELDREMDDAEKSKMRLAEERDTLKTQLDNKERVHGESRKQLNDLERISKAAQRKKSAKERDLQKKRSERQKMKEDIAQWASERESLQQQTHKLRGDTKTERERQVLREADAQKNIDDKQAIFKKLEDEMRDWGIKALALEEERRLEGERQEEEEAEADRVEKDEENKYQSALHDLEQKFVQVQQAMASLDPQLEEARRRVRQESWRYPQGVVDGGQYPYDMPRSARGSISQGMNNVPFPSSTYGPSHTAAPASFPRIPSSSPFSAGLTALNYPLAGFSPEYDDDELGMSGADVEELTGGAMMSPSADGLLPSNLLRDDPESTLRPSTREPTTVISDLFGPMRKNTQPQSPASQHSGARSFLASPPADEHASLHSENGTNGPDIDRAMNNLNDAAPRRSIFGSWAGKKPRESAARDQSSILPTLKQGEPQSFGPDDEDDTSNSHGHQRNLSTLTNPFVGLSKGSMDDMQVGASPSQTRKPRFFARKSQVDKEPFYGLDRTSSPRPPSTYSYDPQITRSGDSQPYPFANSSGLDVFQRYRNSPLGTDWASMNDQTYSAGPSRRPSIGYGSTGNLSMGSSVLPKDTRTQAAVAPIGSGRPGKNNKVKRLNPNAQSFVYGMFSRGENKKTPKTDKGSFPDIGQSRRSVDTGSPGSAYEDGPRASRDGFSVMTSTTDSHDSVGGDSLGNSDVATSTTSTSTPKDNLLSRLTRKSSSSKFTTPWSKDRKDRDKDKDKHATNLSLSLSSRRRSLELPLTPSEADEDGSDYLGQSVGSAYGSTYGSNLGTPVDGRFDDRLDDGKKAKSAARGSLSSSWSKMMGGKKKKETSTAMSETSESRDEDE